MERAAATPLSLPKHRTKIDGKPDGPHGGKERADERGSIAAEIVSRFESGVKED
jgi:hypothetical protein